MSKTFSKILLICALAVVLPLMIVGTSLAAYYSLNATVAVGIQLDTQAASANAYAKVVYNNSRHAEKFEINASHTKTITLKAEANGYDFKGWYEGDLEAYATDEGKWIDQENKTVEVKIADIDNVLAVFEAHTYTVEYSYQPDPNNATRTSDVPVGFANTLTYGQHLPTTSNATFAGFPGHRIKNDGWRLRNADNSDFINDTYYTVAEFPELDTYILWAEWEEDEQITVTYKYNGETIDGGVVNGYATIGAVIADPADYAAAAGVGALADGTKLVWMNGETVVQAGARVYENTTLELRVVDVTYTLNVTPADDMALATGVSGNVSFTRTNAADNLAAILDNANWTNRYSFWTFAGIKIGDNTYTTAADILAAFEAESANANVTLNATSAMNKNFTTVSVTNVTYNSTNDDYINDDATFDQPIYHGDPASVLTAPLADSASTADLLDWIFEGETFYKDSAKTTPVNLYEIEINGITISEAELQNIVTINDLIDVYYRKVVTKPANAETLTLTTVALRFV